SVSPNSYKEVRTLADSNNSRKMKQCLCLYSWSLIARQLQIIVVYVVAFANIILSLRKNEGNEAINLLLGR
ncbi:hypothetical protein, partial [Hoylesella shahii]|uniref:hypothetical protein n=1 Tax=Hoylesella shahii TaxID=228603 RepID=UPI002354EA28